MESQWKNRRKETQNIPSLTRIKWKRVMKQIQKMFQ